MIYYARFCGKTKEAIGISYWIETSIEANNNEEARLKLYGHYENIQHLYLEIQEKEYPHVKSVTE